MNKFQACQKKPGSAIQLLCTSDFIKNAHNKTANRIINSNNNKYGDNSFKGERGSDAKIGDDVFSFTIIRPQISTLGLTLPALRPPRPSLLKKSIPRPSCIEHQSNLQLRIIPHPIPLVERKSAR